MHAPVFDHVLVPGEFVETIADKFFDSPAASDETFHVRVVDGAADIELLVTQLTKATTTSTTPPKRREGEKMFTGGI